MNSSIEAQTTGSGPKLLLVHGLGGSRESWSPVLPVVSAQRQPMCASPVTRTALLAQLSARPWALPPDLVERELTSFATTATVAPLIEDLARGPAQAGPASAAAGSVTIGWRRKDRLCPPRQAGRAQAAFPSAALHWFKDSGHYSIWDSPEEAAELILRSTAINRP